MENMDLVPVEIENIVVGQVLYEADAISRAARMLKAEHFALPTPRLIYATALDMWSEGKPVDILTMTVELRKRGTLDMVGGPFEISRLTNAVAQTIHLDYHCAIILEYYGKRVLRQAGLNLAENTNIAAENDDLISDITLEIAKAASAEMQADVNAGERAYSMLNEVKPKPLYLRMDAIDEYVFVFPGNMITVSAPSGVGKTAFALSVVLNLIDQVKPWFVSLEMPADELLTRALCQLACVDIAEALQDRLSDTDKARMAGAAIAHGDALSRLSIEDSGHMSIDRFKSLAEHKVKNEGVQMIVVDYAQLMEADQREHKGIAAQNEAISKGLRHVARSLNVIMLVVVHLNREGEAHGSTQYEKDAHVRFKLSRDGKAPYMDVEIPKNRNGRTGSCRTPFEGKYGLVGRVATLPTFSARLPIPPPDNRIEPTKDTDEIAPF